MSPINIVNSEVIARLRRILKPTEVVDDETELLVYECDGLPLFKNKPDVVVFPTTADQVGQIVRLANEYRIPFLPRGAGTGLSGGALAVEGGILIELQRMNRILSIDVENGFAVVQPGVVNLHISQAAAPYGLYYAPDPSSQMSCTIGGNVAENSGGPHCLKYGMTTNHILAIEAVTSSGEIIRLGNPAGEMIGMDLIGTIVGSEGTFAIVTEITIRLLPKPQAVKTLLAAFHSVEDCSQTVSDVIAAGIVPAAMEMVDAKTIEAVEASVYKAGYPTDAVAALLIEVDGFREGLEETSGAIVEICRRNHAYEVRVAKDDEERARLWLGRKGAFGAMGRLAPDMITMDAVIPRTRLPEVLLAIDRMSERYGLGVANVFHAGDGNLHPLILFDSRYPDQVDKILGMSEEIMKLCVGVGGSLSGEHGIGYEKKDFMDLVFSDPDLDTMMRVKQVFNPDGLLNPSKIFPSRRGCTEVGKHTTTSTAEIGKRVEEILLGTQGAKRKPDRAQPQGKVTR
ncbi:MAG TPA: FAD-linked oxidase C-terminal domain-containing protein [Terriglobia bacterium]|nr:FAD-linked oxidase C-terminal domain-containing protein [Terriglobia bacterium]